MPITKSKTELLRRLLQRELIPPARKIIENLKPADLKEIMLQLTPTEQKLMITILHLAGKIGLLFKDLDEYNLKKIMAALPDKLIVKILSQSKIDDAKNLLDNMENQQKERIIKMLPADLTEQLESLLLYPPDTAGSIMNTDFLKFYENQTAEEAMNLIRKWNHPYKDPIYAVYLLDETDRLMGFIPFRVLALADQSKKLSELDLQEPVVADIFMSLGELSKIMAKYDLVSIPVVDEQYKMYGIITIDNVIGSILDGAAEDAFLLQGITDEVHLDTPVTKTVKSRLPWMIINLFTAFIASSVVGFFESSIQQYVALATFMPIIAGLGGNTGSQTLTVMIRALTLGETDNQSKGWIIFKQVFIAIILSLIVGSLTALISYLWRGNIYLGLVVFSAMIINMALGGLVGSGIPLLLKKIGQDPAMGGGILITATTDSLGFLTFLGIATMFLQYL